MACELRNMENEREICAMNIHSFEQHLKRMNYVHDCTLDQVMKKDARIKALEEERFKLNSYNIQKPAFHKTWSFLSFSLSNELNPKCREMTEIENEIEQMEKDCEQFTALIFEIDKETRFTKEWIAEMKSAINEKEKSVFLLHQEKEVLVMKDDNGEENRMYSDNYSIKKINTELEFCLNEQKEFSDKLESLKAKEDSLEKKKIKVCEDIERKREKIKALKKSHINLAESSSSKSKFVHSIESDESVVSALTFEYDDFASSNVSTKNAISSADYKLRMNKISNDLRRFHREKNVLSDELKRLQVQISDASKEIHQAKAELYEKSNEILVLTERQIDLKSRQKGFLDSSK